MIKNQVYACSSCAIIIIIIIIITITDAVSQIKSNELTSFEFDNGKKKPGVLPHSRHNMQTDSEPDRCSLSLSAVMLNFKLAH